MATRNLNRIFVANLRWTIGHQELRNYFNEFGKVINSSVVFDRNTGLSKGYGFITFASKDAIEKVNNQKNHLLEDWALNIQPVTGTPMKQK